MLVIDIAVAKTAKYALPESGDTVEVVERPGGGITLIMADGQTSGHAAKAVSNMVVRKAAALVLEGVRDGAAARAASDYLYTAKGGRVSADLIMISADLQSRTLVVTRNCSCPVAALIDSELKLLAEPSSAVGMQRSARPQITELELEPNTTILAFTDGVWEAGMNSTRPAVWPEWLDKLLMGSNLEPVKLAESVLEEAIQRDGCRPRDDMTVACLVAREACVERAIRRLQISFPVGWPVHGR